MIKITDYIHCYENVLDKNICKAIIDNSKDLERTKKFLDKEISAVLKFGNLKNKLKKNIKF